MRIKVMDDAESQMMVRAQFKRLRPNDVIVLYEGGSVRRPGIVREIWDESFSFIPLDPQGVEKMLSGTPPEAEIKTLPSGEPDKKLLWNNVSS